MVVTTQSEKQLTFTDFKVALRSFEDTEKSCTENNDDYVVMKAAGRSINSKPQIKKSITCYACSQGHKADSCDGKAKNRLWCNFCKTSTHNDIACRKRMNENAIKQMHDDQDNADSRSFAFFKLESSDYDNESSHLNSFLVDCGATAHVVKDLSKFVQFDEHFNPEKHFIELADGTKTNNVAVKKGDANIVLNTSEGKPITAELKNALYVPSYPQNIFSVQAATEKGSTVVFSPHSAELITNDGTKFNIEKHGNLYYLCSNISTTCGHSHNLKEWHEIL